MSAFGKGFKDYGEFRRRQQHIPWGAVAQADPIALVAALGGDSAVSAIYDVRYNVTLNGSAVSAWDDARGPAGFGPQLAQPTAARQPAWTGGADSAKLITFTDAVQRSMQTAAVPAFDISTAKTCVIVGAAPIPTGASYIGGFNDSATVNGAILLSQQVSTVIQGEFFPGGTTLNTTVATSATKRVLFITTNGSTTGFAEAPSLGQKSVTITAIGSRNCALVLGQYWDTHGNSGGFATRAVIVLSGAYSTAQRDTIDTWAVANHGAVLA